MVTGCSVVVIFMAVANGSKSTLASFPGLWPGNEAKDTAAEDEIHCVYMYCS